MSHFQGDNLKAFFLSLSVFRRQSSVRGFLRPSGRPAAGDHKNQVTALLNADCPGDAVGASGFIIAISGTIN